MQQGYLPTLKQNSFLPDFLGGFATILYLSTGRYLFCCPPHCSQPCSTPLLDVRWSFETTSKHTKDGQEMDFLQIWDFSGEIDTVVRKGYVNRHILLFLAYFRNSSAVQTTTPSISLSSSISIISTVILQATNSTPSICAVS